MAKRIKLLLQCTKFTASIMERKEILSFPSGKDCCSYQGFYIISVDLMLCVSLERQQNWHWMCFPYFCSQLEAAEAHSQIISAVNPFPAVAASVGVHERPKWGWRSTADLSVTSPARPDTSTALSQEWSTSILALSLTWCSSIALSNGHGTLASLPIRTSESPSPRHQHCARRPGLPRLQDDPGGSRQKGHNCWPWQSWAWRRSQLWCQEGDPLSWGWNPGPWWQQGNARLGLHGWPRWQWLLRSSFDMMKEEEKHKIICLK